MDALGRPYEERITSPLLFFYPMFHPIYDKMTPEKSRYFSQILKQKPETRKNAEVYIHIPFCDSFCHMCPCYKTHTPRDKGQLRSYVDKLKKEIRYYTNADYLQSLDIEYVHIGGGTPSVLPPELIMDLINYTKQMFSLGPDTQIGFEGEVCSLNDEKKIASLREAGCNRISFGIQTLNPESRKLSGLIPTPEEIRTCINILREYGYSINFDLMFGLPGQTFDIWKEDLARAVDLGAQCLDIYELVLYPTTRLFWFRHKVQLADEMQRLDMLQYAIAFLSQNGFEQKSNAVFERGDDMWHKINTYQDATTYPDTIAIGDNAIGCINDFAYRNQSPIDVYMSWDETDHLPIRFGLPMDKEDRLAKQIWNLPKLLKMNKSNREQVIAYYRPVLDSMLEKGLVDEDEKSIFLTDLGRLWTDNIFLEFTPEKQKNRMWKIMY